MLTRISLFTICLLTLIHGAAFAEDFPFGTQTFEEALAEAKKDKKPLLVKVYAVWCGPCKRMDKQVFADPKMMALASDFVAIKVDGDTEYGKSFNQNNKVSKYPTTLFFNAEGKEVYRLIGFRNIAGFMNLMDPFLKGTLRPEGSPPPLSTFQVAYRTTFHHAVNTPEQLEKAMKSLDKITVGAPQEEQAMTEYLRGAWLERRGEKKNK
jgi:thiol-disulfide isomerase/thioredoxin